VTFETRPIPAVPIAWLPEEVEPATASGRSAAIDPAAVLLTRANCGAPMDERKCKLICRCGYFLSCSDNY
jgi:hypothetical protein